MPSPQTAPSSALSSVSCASSNDCWAIGSAGAGTLAVHWDGATWTAVPVPAPGASSFLRRVTCRAGDDCWAVGAYAVSGRNHTLAVHWDGKTWSVVVSPDKSTTADNVLQGVTCTSSGDCWAVGEVSFTGYVFPDAILLEHWNGHAWSLVNASGSQPSYGALRGVTCLSTAECWVTGSFLFDADTALFERWNGAAWSFVPSPVENGHGMCAVSCASGNDCWAVGECNGGDPWPLAQHWDGAAWAVVETPEPFSEVSALLDVTCTSATNCWAVGFHDYSQPLIEHWDGAAWTLVSVAPHLQRAVSRKIHGAAGAFDVELSADYFATRTECRSGGAAGNYQVVFAFAENVVSVQAAGADRAQITSSFIGPNPNEYTVNLSNVSDASYVPISLNLVKDAAGHIGNADTLLATLIGDTSGDRLVNSADVIQTRSHSGEATDAANFRSDVNADGNVNSGDALTVRSRSGDSLP